MSKLSETIRAMKMRNMLDSDERYNEAIDDVLDVVDEHEQKAILMHDELTLMLKRMLYGKWVIAEVEAILKKAREI